MQGMEGLYILFIVAALIITAPYVLVLALAKYSLLKVNFHYVNVFVAIFSIIVLSYIFDGGPSAGVAMSVFIMYTLIEVGYGVITLIKKQYKSFQKNR